MRQLMLSFVAIATLLACYSCDSINVPSDDSADAGIWVGYNEHPPTTCGAGICDLNEDTTHCAADCEGTGTGTETGDGNDPADCSGCVDEASDCQASCQNKGFVGGFCIAPGSANPDVCCMCSKLDQPPSTDIVCEDGYGDCDGDASNQCETNLNTEMHHCGACKKGCNLPNATPKCKGGKCEVGTCNPGYDNCDQDDSNGCETNLNTTPDHCGDCGQGCGFSIGAGSCVDGKCQPATCQPGTGNCGGSAIASGAKVVMLSEAWNQYCAAKDDAQHSVMCNKGTAGASEHYTINKINGTGPLHSGDTVAIFSAGWDKYCAAEDFDNHVMHCNRDAPGAWEKYVISKVSGGGSINTGDTVSFRTVEWNTYCSAEGTGGHPMRCNTGSVGASERFQLLLGTEPVPEVPGPNPGPTCGDGECNGGESKNNCPGDCGSPPPLTSDCTTVLSDSLAGGTSGSKDGGSFSGGGWKAPHQIKWDLGQHIAEGSFSVEVTNWNPNGDSPQHEHGKQQIINMYEASHGRSDYADNPKTSYFNIRTGDYYKNGYKFFASTGGYDERDDHVVSKPYGAISPDETHTLLVVWTADGTITSYLNGKAEAVLHFDKSFAFRYVFIGTDNTMWDTDTYGPQLDVIYKNLVVNSGNTGPDGVCGQ